MRDDANQTAVIHSTDRYDMSQKANELRKNKEFENALVLYRKLSKDSSDSYSAAGLLHCLRKLKQFDEALSLCSEPSRTHLALDWYKNEVIWVFIEGKLNRLDDTASLEDLVRTAESILALQPQDTTTKWTVVRRTLKAAKSKSRWDLVFKWTKFVDPRDLSTKPIKDDRGRDGWCDKSIWYNCRIRSLIEIGNKEEAIQLAQQATDLFPKQAKFFGRLEALANLQLGRLIEADRLYKKVSSTWRDWWILHEHGEVLQKLGKSQDALKTMCQAALSSSKLETMVSLFSDIGFLCLEMELKEDARNHLVLCKNVREQQEWSIPETVSSTLMELNSQLPASNFLTDLKSVLDACRSFWSRSIGTEDEATRSSPKKGIKRALKGKLILGSSEKPFCFISASANESIYCLKSDLPRDIAIGTLLEFDAVPSFDKKKNKESWKAVNIRPA